MSFVKLKLEKALTALLKDKTEFAGLNIEEGHSPNKPDLPLMAVFCYDSQPSDDMPSDTGIENVMLRIFIEASSNEDDENSVTREQIDAWVIEINSFMLQIPALQALINKTEEPDMREIKQLHVYDVTPAGSADDSDGLRWIEEREFVVLCSPETAF